MNRPHTTAKHNSGGTQEKEFQAEAKASLGTLGQHNMLFIKVKQATLNEILLKSSWADGETTHNLKSKTIINTNFRTAITMRWGERGGRGAGQEKRRTGNFPKTGDAEISSKLVGAQVIICASCLTYISCTL